MPTPTQILFPLIFLAALLSGCVGAPTVSMGAADRLTIKVVSVSKEVQLPAQFNFHERGAGIGAVFGLVGALVEHAATSGNPVGPESNGSLILRALKNNNISVQDIVRTEFIKEATGRGSLKVVDTAVAPDAVLSLVINSYGLGRTHAFGEQLHPVLNVSASMKKPDGTVVWQKTDYVSAVSADNKKTGTLEEYKATPELLRAAFTNAASIVGRWLVEKLPAQN